MADTPRLTTQLERSVTTPLLTLYGIGPILGPCIYAPFAFLLASFPAIFTGTSIAEFASRFPRAGGEAIYISEGFNNRHQSLFVGIFIVFAGVVSSGVLIRSFVGYAQHFMGMPSAFWIGMLAITLVNAALLRVKADPAEVYDGFPAPVWMTWIGLFSSAVFACISLYAMFS